MGPIDFSTPAQLAPGGLPAGGEPDPAPPPPTPPRLPPSDGASLAALSPLSTLPHTPPAESAFGIAQARAGCLASLAPRAKDMAQRLDAMSAQLRLGDMPSTAARRMADTTQNGLLEVMQRAASASGTGRPSPLQQALRVLLADCLKENAAGWDWAGTTARLTLRSRIDGWTGKLLALTSMLAPHQAAGRDALADATQRPPAAPARRDDFLDIAYTLKSSATACTPQALRTALIERHLWADHDDVQTCAALESPPDHPEIAGLGLFIASMQSAYDRDADLFDDPGRFADAIIAGVQGPASSDRLRAFVRLYMAFIAPYLALKARGFEPLPGTVDAVWRRYDSERLTNFRQLATAHQASLIAVIAAWSRRGLPVHAYELGAYFARNRVRPSPKQLLSMNRLLTGVTVSGRYFVLEGEAPSELHVFNRTAAASILFRGSAPACTEGAQAPQGASGDEGLCAALLQRYPGGFSMAELKETIQQYTPRLDVTARALCLRSMTRNGLFVPVGAGQYIVNPALLCKTVRQQLLAACPPPHRWPRQFQRLPAARRSDATRSTPARRLAADTRRGQFAETTRGMARAAAVFRTLEALDATDALAPYLREAGSGQPRFHEARLARLIRQNRCPDITQSHVWEVLMGIAPHALPDVLRQRQWEKNRLPPHEIMPAFQALQQALPFCYCLPTSSIAALINQRLPDFYLDTISLRGHLQSLPDDEAEREKIVDALFADKRISLFRPGRGAPVHLRALHSYLALQGIHCRNADLADLVEAHLATGLHDGDAYTKTKLASTERRCHAAAEMILAQAAVENTEVATWEPYLQTFHAVFCQPRRRGAPLLCYSGSDATRIYLAVQALQASRAAAAGQTRRAAKRPADDMPGSSAPKRLRAIEAARQAAI